MQPRRLRLGDVVDDYCSRCRLLSNHAIAAIVDDVIKQTRCSTCDFEHPYKDGKLPVRRARKDGTSALYQQVLDNVTDGVPDDADVSGGETGVPDTSRPRPSRRSPPPARFGIPNHRHPGPRGACACRSADAGASRRRAASPVPAPPAPLAAAPASQPAETRDAADEAIVHRRLIRATLPKVEGAEREPRPIPTFTVHEAANARGKFRRFPARPAAPPVRASVMATGTARVATAT